MAAEETLIIKPKVKIKVFGVGGGGNSVLMRMGQHNDLDIELIAVNTDAKQLSLVSQDGVKPVQIGEALTRGRGTGGSVELGEQAAKEAENRLREAMSGAHLHHRRYGRWYRHRGCSCSGASGQRIGYPFRRCGDGAFQL